MQTGWSVSKPPEIALVAGNFPKTEQGNDSGERGTVVTTEAGSGSLATDGLGDDFLAEVAVGIIVVIDLWLIPG
jgi:hypothetical protein